MSKAKISRLLSIGILVSETDNVIHFAYLVKQVSVDCFYDQDLAHCLVKQAKDHLWLNKTLPNI